MLKETVPVSESITELRTQLDQFRSTHPRRTRLPESIWQSAAELARCHGIYVVAHSLRLDYCTLKKHVSGSPESASRHGKKMISDYETRLWGLMEKSEKTEPAEEHKKFAKAVRAMVFEHGRHLVYPIYRRHKELIPDDFKGELL